MAKRFGVVIDDPASMETFTQYAEADMRRFWSHRCIVHRKPDCIFIDVGSPQRIRVKMSVERLASFAVKARAGRCEVWQ